MREYLRLDPTGTLMGTPLEGCRSLGSRYGRVKSVVIPGGVEHLQSGVLGLDLRGEKRDGATVLVIRDPRTGEEFASALEVSEQQRRILEDQVRAEKARASTAEAEASAAKERVRVLDQRLSLRAKGSSRNKSFTPCYRVAIVTAMRPQSDGSALGPPWRTRRAIPPTNSRRAPSRIAFRAISWVLSAGAADRGETSEGHGFERLALYADSTYALISVDPQAGES
ncbi:MAG: hypothetical protein OXN96_04260 [Bryobacterales bacterium]|nr:hypothetical protein [Bryobacterales bacterium]